MTVLFDSKLALFDCYRGARVLVTGSSGFKGRWLTNALRDLRADVTGYSLPDDVRSPSFLAYVVKEVKPDFVFHLAAQAFVPRGFTDPQETFETNVMGTVNLLEALRRAARPCAVVVVTTDKVYGGARADGRAHIETDPLVGCCPYAASKVGAEHAVAAYRTLFAREPFRIAVATARAGNVIGGGDWGEGRLIPNAIRALREDKPITIWNPAAVRPWQFVKDVVDGYLRLGFALTASRELNGVDAQGAWNFGPLHHYTVKEVVEKVIAAWGSGSWVQGSTTLHEVEELRIDSTKAYVNLGWTPMWTLDAAIKEIVEWHKSPNV